MYQTSFPPQIRVLELFAGIGGLACVWSQAKLVSAIDISRQAAAVYRQNFRHPYAVREIESLSCQDLRDFQSDFWWLSPPCQPFSRRGQRRDIGDTRTGGLLRIIDAIDIARPFAIGLENVVGFGNSQAHQRLVRQLDANGYQVATKLLCPSQLGWPNRRPRFYLLASLGRLPEWQPLPLHDCRLADFVDENANRFDPGNGLWLTDDEAERYASALDRIETLEGKPISACFAGSYGRTLLHSGSYLRIDGRYRRFTPREVARLLGFPDSYNLDGQSQRTTWKLLGNSLSLPAVRYILSHVLGPS